MPTRRSALIWWLLGAVLAPAPASPGAWAAPAGGGRQQLHALLINGGGSPDENYHSHVVHLERMLGLLERAGVAKERVTVLASDGGGPDADLAVRDEAADGYWLLEPTELGELLEPPLEHVDSKLPAARTLLPATRANVQRYFADARKSLRAGDTLFLYVTDHGDQGRRDPLDNRIVLWGKDESLSVRQLGVLIDTLPAGVRVVTLMSQCFSGGFAELAVLDPAGPPSGAANMCGYFSSTADRPAYGCYPESRDDGEFGHSFEFFRALTAAGGSLARAHESVLVADHTPDVPLRTSDVFLERQLGRAAKAAGRPLVDFGDELLAEALAADPAHHESALRLLDRIGQSFGMASPRSLREIDDAQGKLQALLDQLETHGKAWHEGLGDLATANLQRFLRSRPDREKRVKDVARAAEHGDPSGKPADAAEVGKQLVAELIPFSRQDVTRYSRLEKMHAAGERSDEAAYRLEVRLAALLRMRTVLEDIAGRALVGKTKPAPEKAGSSASAALARLDACEGFALPLPPARTAAVAVAGEPYPTFEEEMKLAAEVLPAWLGIQFQPLAPQRRLRLALSEGASAVVAVFPESPAAKAGIQVGDVVLGPPGAPFRDPNEVRTWTMLSDIGKPEKLEVLRDDKHVTLTLTPAARPVKWPSLPGPPKVGALAPALHGDPYRGPKPIASLVGAGDHLLVFWATWCGPCKASLPEVLAFGHERGVQVIAITDEPSDVLTHFFAKWDKSGKPFPEMVVSDESRRTFSAYGVSGTPTFVLVDATGHVRAYSVGYDAVHGLPLPGWRWKNPK